MGLPTCPICGKRPAYRVIDICNYTIEVCYPCFQEFHFWLKNKIEEGIANLLKPFRCSICKDSARTVIRFNDEAVFLCSGCKKALSHLSLRTIKTFEELKKKIEEEREKERKELLKKIKGSIENLEILWGKFEEGSFYGNLKKMLESMGEDDV
jgi:ribosomal protein L37AE/L43A